MTRAHVLDTLAIGFRPDSVVLRDYDEGNVHADRDRIVERGLGEPWHPQIELIARALTSHRRGAWVMRRRTQEEMDQLAAAAGFEKVEQRIDEWGIFTVSLARRRGEE